MSSLPLISHRLFVAAIQDENGLRTKPLRDRAIINLPDTANIDSLRRINSGQPGPGTAARIVPDPADAAA